MTKKVASKKDNKAPEKQDKNPDMVEELQKRIEKLEQELADQKEITQKAQSDYFRYKMDMDAYMTRAEEAKKESRVDAVIAVGAKMLPFVTQLKQSLAHIPEALQDDAWVEWIKVIYKKALGDLSILWIFPIDAEVGTDPDLTLHMPVNMQDTDDKKLKGKIMQEVEAGRRYEKDGVMKVIVPAKIVVGS